MAEQIPQSAQQVFDAGTKLLSESKFSEAADNFKAILDKGVTSSDLEANYGHALVESGQVGPGILHLMDAVALDRFDTRTRDDLSFAQSKVESGLGQPMSHPVEWGNRIGSVLRPGESLALAALCGLALLAALAFRRKLRRAQTFALILAALGFVAAAGFAQYGKSTAIALSAAELHASPLSTSELIQTLPPGTRMRVIRTSGEFAEVERTGAFRGWTLTSALVHAPY